MKLIAAQSLRAVKIKTHSCFNAPTSCEKSLKNTHSSSTLSSCEFCFWSSTAREVAKCRAKLTRACTSFANLRHATPLCDSTRHPARRGELKDVAVLDIGHQDSPTKMLRGLRKACRWQRARRSLAGVRHRDSDYGAQKPRRSMWILPSRGYMGPMVKAARRSFACIAKTAASTTLAIIS